ncbi:MAG: hypothetical protein WCL51_16220 [Bacteroidota bacterium]
MGKFIAYKKFQYTEQLKEVVDVLKANDINYIVEDNTLDAAAIFIGQDTGPKILLKISNEDFTKANELLNIKAKKDIDKVNPDHYLFSFEDDELLEIVEEPDTWNEFDVQLAKKILTERGIEISEKLENAFIEKRIKNLSKTEKGSKLWTTVGYISAFVGGLLGIAIGLALWKSKRTLPNGDRVYMYSDNDRIHGMYITVIGIAMFLMIIIVRMTI